MEKVKIEIAIPSDTTKGKWVVEENGDLSHYKFKEAKDLELCESPHYVIEKERLTEDDWITHLTSKWWFNELEFAVDYYIALRVNGIKEITVKLPVDDED